MARLGRLRTLDVFRGANSRRHLPRARLSDHNARLQPPATRASTPLSVQPQSPPMTILHYQTPQAWLDTVLGDFDPFLQDHASAEKKAAGMAVNMISHYPDRRTLVSRMSDLAVEEMTHYREVIRLLHERNMHPADDTKDHYVAALRKEIRKGPEYYLLDQLLIAGIIEARGAERFGLVAEGLPPGRLKNFYEAINRSEERHHQLFFDLAAHYFPRSAAHADPVAERLQALLAREAEICAALPLRAALH